MSKYSVTIDGYTFEVEVEAHNPAAGRARLLVNGRPVTVQTPEPPAAGRAVEWFIVDDRPCEATLDGDFNWVRSNRGIYALEIQDMDPSLARPPTGDGRVKAPIPGIISQVMAAVGDEVEAGQPLLVLEAMKMENEIRAGRSGTVKILNVAPGQRVSLNDLLAEID
ncbi:MAG: biotin/lipoyl-containing protein [Chloroflexota bacterium]